MSFASPFHPSMPPSSLCVRASTPPSSPSAFSTPPTTPAASYRLYQSSTPASSVWDSQPPSTPSSMSDWSGGWLSPSPFHSSTSPPPPPSLIARGTIDLEECNNRVIIQRLCEPPTDNDFTEHAKHWATSMWHTTDGIHFYLLHDTTLHPVTEVPPCLEEEVLFLTVDHLKWLASRPQKFVYLQKTLDSIRLSDTSSSDKVQKIRKLLQEHPMAIAKHLLIPIKDGNGLIVSFKYPEPRSSSARHIFRTLENLSLQTFPEERFYPNLHRHNSEEEDWTSSESDK